MRGLELRLVLELCDCGSLRDVLDQGAFLQGDGRVNYRAVLETALDIARGMMQLHALDLVHSDLKVWRPECGAGHCWERPGVAGGECMVSDQGLAILH